MSGRKIFVCYRREDSAGHAGRLYDRLNLRFPGRVFMDVAGIGLGTRWAEVIEQTLASCEVVLMLVGRRWLERDSEGRRRIDDPDDPLRAEITTALKLQRRIVPVLVGGAAMPGHDELPAEVAPAVDWQALRVDDDDFDHDASRLTRALEGYLQEAPADPHLEQEGAKRARIEALFQESARAAAQGAWVTAAQTLRSVISLDPGNARAAAELRDVEARWAAAYRSGQTARVVAPSRGRWAMFGAVGVVVVLCGVAAVILLALMVIVANQDQTTADPSGAFGPDGPGVVQPPAEPPAADEEEDGAAADETTASSQLVGQYLLAAYSQQGMRLPIAGRLTLTDGGGGRLRFETQASNQTTGITVWYRGILQRQGPLWTTTTTESNDPSAVSQPIPTELHFDGTVLTTTNAFGEAAVWHRQ